MTPPNLYAQAEDLIHRSTVDEVQKAHFTARLNAAYATEELETLLSDLRNCQPPRPAGQRPHPDDELSRRLGREK